MIKIIANVNLFSLKQPIFVYENGNKIDAAQVNIEAAAATINNFYQKYNNSEIILQGAKNYINKIRKELKEKYDLPIG